MFGIGGTEFLLVAVGALLILGPKRLPEALRTLGLWQRNITSGYRSLRWELEREMPSDEPTDATSTEESQGETDPPANIRQDPPA